jgi:TetR/AcrR family fatty acid metabolism transcriptional regulator
MAAAFPAPGGGLMAVARRTAAQDSLRDLRRSQIVAAAREIVAGDGLPALTIGALEKRLGFSRGVISYHFRDKDEIVDAVLASALAEIDLATHALVAAGTTAVDKVRAVLRANLHGFLGHREAGLILLSFWGRLGSDPKARRANARLYAVYRERTASVLTGGIDSGAFGAADVPALAAVIVGLVLGIASQAYFEPGSIDPEAALEEAVACVVARLARRKA